MKKAFGRWTVIGPSCRPGYVKCRCRCGTVRDVYLWSLLSEKSRSCGCLSREIAAKRNHGDLVFLENAKKLIGKTINGLKVLDARQEPPDKNGRREIMLQCQCTCGKLFWARKAHILSGNTRSCGHGETEHLQLGHDAVKNASVAGTSAIAVAARMKGTINKNSGTGMNGVSRTKQGRYRAYINFRRKQYRLGVYDRPEEAAAARKEAENRIYGDFLNWYYAKFPEKRQK